MLADKVQECDEIQLTISEKRFHGWLEQAIPLVFSTALRTVPLAVLFAEFAAARARIGAEPDMARCSGEEGDQIFTGRRQRSESLFVIYFGLFPAALDFADKDKPKWIHGCGDFDFHVCIISHPTLCFP